MEIYVLSSDKGLTMYLSSSSHPQRACFHAYCGDAKTTVFEKCTAQQVVFHLWAVHSAGSLLVLKEDFLSIPILSHTGYM